MSHEFALATPLEWEVGKGAFRQNYCPLSGHEFFEVSACAPIYGEVSASESECTHACICPTFVVSVDSLDLDEMGKRREGGQKGVSYSQNRLRRERGGLVFIHKSRSMRNVHPRLRLKFRAVFEPVITCS